MNTLLMLLFFILADDIRILQVYFLHRQKQKYPLLEERQKENAAFHAGKAQLWKTLPPGGIRNNGISKGTGGSSEHTK